MSRQFYLYLLPADAESLIHTLKSELDLSLIQTSSPKPVPKQIESPMRHGGLMLKNATAHADCYITPAKEADIRMRFVSTLSHWNVDDKSEVIEFSGCEFDGHVLVRGRLYFQNDLLAGDMIAPKRKEFLAWADKVFRLAKKSLHRSEALDAYVGEHALKWRQEGGRFAWTVNHVRGAIFEADESTIKPEVK
jgi:hypothetical protein